MSRALIFKSSLTSGVLYICGDLTAQKGFQIDAYISEIESVTNPRVGFSLKTNFSALWKAAMTSILIEQRNFL